jgi:hypothetical protein
MSSDLEVSAPMAFPKGESRGRVRALTMVLVFLFLSNICDPGGALGLKYIAFFIAFFPL